MLKYIPYVLMFAVATMTFTGGVFAHNATRNRISPTCSVKRNHQIQKALKKISR